MVGKFALTQCQLIQSGRMHQIRQHLRSIDHPIVGDRLYSKKTPPPDKSIGAERSTAEFGQVVHRLLRAGNGIHHAARRGAASDCSESAK